MPESAVELARSLEACLEEVLAVYTIQGEHAEAAKRHAEATRARFDQVMAGLKSGDPTARQDWMADISARTDMTSVSATIRDSGQLSLRWETAFCDAYDALIGLAAFPELRESAGRVSELIRTLRLLQVESFNAELPAVDDSPQLQDIFRLDAKVEPEVGSQSGEASSKYDRVQGFMGRMDVMYEKIQEGFAEKIRLTDQALHAALHAAREVVELASHSEPQH